VTGDEFVDRRRFPSTERGWESADARSPQARGDHVVHAFALRGAVDLGQTEDRPPESRAWAEPLEQVLLDVIL
jgi:hypothetical protein